MASLVECGFMQQRLKDSKKSLIEILHKYVFHTEGDRKNRDRLRHFQGFNFTQNSNEYSNKRIYVEANLTQADLSSICTLLGIDHNANDLMLHIFKNLCQGNLLKDAENDEAENTDDDGEDAEASGSKTQATQSIGTNDTTTIHKITEQSIYEDYHSVDGDVSEPDMQRNKVNHAANSEIRPVAHQYNSDNRTHRFALHFRDVEESVRIFDGNGTTSVEDWISDFEDMSVLMGWDPLQMLIFARKSLKGLAKLFISGEKQLTTWPKLRNALLDEFSKKLNSAEIHKMLFDRKMKNNEDVQEYFYTMRDIAAQGNVEEDALIQHVINGIKDLHVNKAMLYGAKTLKEFREKLRSYDAFTKQQNASNEMQPKDKTYNNKQKIYEEKKQFPTTSKNVDKNVMRCYSCGRNGHVSPQCPTKDLGPKCFKCNGHGHIATKCTKQKEKTGNVYEVTRVAHKKYSKVVSINGREVEALIDTASDLTLMREDEYEALGFPELKPTDERFTGIDSIPHEAIGKFVALMVADDLEFSIMVTVVSKQCCPPKFLLGADFLSTINFKANKGELLFETEYDTMNNTPKEDLPEIFQINTIVEHDNKEIELQHIQNEEIKHNINEIVQNYKPQKLMKTTVEMKLVLKDDEPVYQKARRLSQLEQKIVSDQIEEWSHKGIIRTSSSDYASPVVLVKKKNGQYRLCIDYRKLNCKIVRDRYPLPLMEDQIDQLQGALVFSTIDLKDGFFHIPMAESSIKYTSFIVPNGQYEFLKVPFGLCNSPSVFQRYVNAVLKDVIREGIVVVYMDDVMILAKTYEEAFNRLKRVLLIASSAGFNINWKKCNFLCTKIEYLGHIIENGTVRPSDHKTKAVTQFGKPTTVRQVQSFLGLSGYFRKFVKSYATIARPLTNLLRSDVKFKFGNEEEAAFDSLKKILSEQPILSLYRSDAETELHTDASKYGFGAILLQRNDETGLLHPVYYASGKTSIAEEKYSSYELEVLAVVKAIRRFRVYLLGIEFKLVTDCKALTQTLQKKDLNARVARWALALEEFKYRTEHRSAKNMKHVDALSRNPLPSCLMITESANTLLNRIKKAQMEDDDFKSKIASSQSKSAKGFVLQRGVLMKEVGDELRVAIPKSMQYQVIRTMHERGHFGINKTEILVSNEYWMPNIRNKVEKVIKNCLICILAEKQYGKNEGLLHPIEKGSVPLHTYHIDHLGPLASTKKSYAHIFVVIDAFAKYVWLYATKSTTSAEVIKILKKQSISFGNPRRIISDKGTAFTSNEFKEYCKDEDIIHSLITTGMPRGNGQVERINRILISMITKISAPNDKEWFRYLDEVQQIINTTPQTSTKHTPFKLMFGVEANFKNRKNINELLKSEIEDLFNTERDELREEARKAIAVVQERNKKYFNKNRKIPFSYRDGDIVAIRKTNKTPGSKFSNKYVGPYEITRTLRGNRYLVNKIGSGEGPKQTSTAPDSMKLWTRGDEDDLSDEDDSSATEGTGRDDQ